MSSVLACRLVLNLQVVTHGEAEVPTDTELYHFTTGPFYDTPSYNSPEPQNIIGEWNKRKPRNILEADCTSGEIEMVGICSSDPAVRN